MEQRTTPTPISGAELDTLRAFARRGYPYRRAAEAIRYPNVALKGWPRCTAELPSIAPPPVALTGAEVWDVIYSGALAGRARVCRTPATVLCGFTETYIDSLREHYAHGCPDPLTEEELIEATASRWHLCGAHLRSMLATELNAAATLVNHDGTVPEVVATAARGTLFSVEVLGVEQMDPDGQVSIIDLRERAS